MAVKTRTGFSPVKLSYLADNCISISQVFIGLAAATAFVGPFDIDKIPVILSNIVLAGAFMIAGWRILK